MQQSRDDNHDIFLTASTVQEPGGVGLGYCLRGYTAWNVYDKHTRKSVWLSPTPDVRLHLLRRRLVQRFPHPCVRRQQPTHRDPLP